MAESHRERERLGVKYADAKRARDELHAQVGRVRDEARAAHDGRLAEELERLTQRSKAELDEIRGKQREAFEREIAGLREAREIAQVWGGNDGLWSYVQNRPVCYISIIYCVIFPFP